MVRQLKIDFISDVTCPWCAIALHNLEQALGRTADVVRADIRFQPFELNPDMRAGGENIDELLGSRYGGGPLFKANFTDNADVSDHTVLVNVAVAAGLDANQARAVLAATRYTDEVRAAGQLWRSLGIHAVPAVVIDDEWVISGGQPSEAFEQALRQLAAADD